MYAFEFLAHDRAGMTLAGVTDGGECEWIGTREQWGNAVASMIAFAETGEYLEEDDYAPYND